VDSLLRHCPCEPRERGYACEDDLRFRQTGDFLVKNQLDTFWGPFRALLYRYKYNNIGPIFKNILEPFVRYLEDTQTLGHGTEWTESQASHACL